MRNSFEFFNWRSRVYLNSQILIRLLSYLSEYRQHEEALVKIFLYAHFLVENYSDNMYSELKEHVQELLYLEEEIKKMTIDPKNDKPIVRYVINRTIWHFTGEE